MSRMKKLLPSDQEIEKYINEYFSENYMTILETQMLSFMKSRYEFNPSEKNDREWKNFSTYVCERKNSKGK